MAKFVFELEAVLAERRRKEERAMRGLADRERAKRDIERRIAETEQRIEVDRTEWRACLGEGVQSTQVKPETGLKGTRIDLRNVRMQAHASLREEMGMRRAALDLAAAISHVDRARGDLIQAARARKAAEILRERRYELWKADQRRKDQAESDELATMRASHKHPEGMA